jgi:hypothetical protein
MAARLPSLSLVDRRNHASREALLRRISGEFNEMPCLRLTRGQAQRLFSLRPDICERVLASLVRDGLLTCGSDGRYRLNDSATWPGRTMLVRPATVRPPKAS